MKFPGKESVSATSGVPGLARDATRRSGRFITFHAPPALTEAPLGAVPAGRRHEPQNQPASNTVAFRLGSLLCEDNESPPQSVFLRGKIQVVDGIPRQLIVLRPSANLPLLAMLPWRLVRLNCRECIVVVAYFEQLRVSPCRGRGSRRSHEEASRSKAYICARICVPVRRRHVSRGWC